MLGQALKMLRNVYGYKAKDLANELSISPSFLSEIENSKKNPTVDLLERYCDIFNLKLSTLILFAEDLSGNNFENNAKNKIRQTLFNFLKRINEQGDTQNEAAI